MEAPSGHLPDLPSHSELPPRPPSPALTDEVESSHSNSNTMDDEGAALLLRDWSIDQIPMLFLVLVYFYHFSKPSNQISYNTT